MKDQIKAYLNGTISNEGLKDLLDFLRSSENNLEYFTQIKMEWESNPHKIISYKSIDGWKKVDQLIGADEKSGFAWMKALYS
ncbi:MAG: hypothetical protein N4A59_02640, partial [Marinifilum sp.]|nr:hypothetical protein [Marinifilum sp.]